MRAACRYSVVRETCSTRPGSVSLSWASISFRICCSSSESGMFVLVELRRCDGRGAPPGSCHCRAGGGAQQRDGGGAARRRRRRSRPEGRQSRSRPVNRAAEPESPVETRRSSRELWRWYGGASGGGRSVGLVDEPVRG